MMAIATELRRNDRCFIVTSDKSHPSYFQLLHSHLQALCKKVRGDDKRILNKLAFVDKVNVLKDFMPEQLKKLLIQMESGEGVTVAQRKKIITTFYTPVLQFFC